MKKEKRFYTYSSPLTLKQIEWLRDHPDPPALLRTLVDAAIVDSVKAKKKKIEELVDTWRLLGDCVQVQKGERYEECIKRLKAVMKQITALRKEIG